ncbi:MAG: PmoA family protein [Saprospiraceae bacterium]
MEVTAAEHPVLVYNTTTLYPGEGLPDHYRRSGFIHPFYTPGGKILTDGFPVGHTHQHGIFFAWVNTTYRGDFTDFWNQHNETGTVAFKELEGTFQGPITAEIQSIQEFQSLKHGPVLDEKWIIRVYHLPDYNVLDITSKQQMIGNDTLFINQYHYGGMGIRLAAEWNEADTVRFTNPMRILTSEGLMDRESANHSRPNWTSVFGDLDGEPAGLALFDHPSNFRYPQPMRVHPNMPYFVQTPSVPEGFMLVPGQEYISNYRIVSFDGLPNAEKLDAMWRAYAKEVEVSWMMDRE